MFTDWDYPSPFTLELTVANIDIDGLGHANNASYVVWCERCAWAHSESLGLSVTDYQRLDRGVAIQKAQYSYFLPCLLADRLIVATWLLKCDRKLRIERHFQIINADTLQTVLRGDWTLVSMILSTGKPIRLPPLFAEIYANAIVNLDPSNPKD